MVHEEWPKMTSTNANLGNYVVDNCSISRCAMDPTLLTRIKELMQEYKGSERYDRTDRGYTMIAAKLEDEGYESTVVCNIIDEVRTW